MKSPTLTTLPLTLDALPVSHAHLAVVELTLFERDVFNMAAPIQSPNGQQQCCRTKHKKFPHQPTRDVSLISGHASYLHPFLIFFIYRGKNALLNV
jgi:hypothetical protein